jgi:hypothetical protein
LLFSVQDGPSALGFTDAEGKRRLELGVNPDGSSRLTVLDNKEKVLFQAPPE